MFNERILVVICTVLTVEANIFTVTSSTLPFCILLFLFSIFGGLTKCEWDTGTWLSPIYRNNIYNLPLVILSS